MAVGKISTVVSGLLLPAFVFLLLPCLSTPLLKTIILSREAGYTFGAWGYCLRNNCTKYSVGYEPAVANGDAANGNFSLPIAVRKGLSYLMPLHPLAALLTLIAFGLAVGSHFSKNFNSARYFLALFLVSLFALVFSTIIFIVDILAFHPDLGFAIWLVMVATIFLLITVLFTFARRRAILNRIEHQRRVDINPEMNGFNHAQTKKLEADAIAARDPDSLPKFAQFDTAVTKRVEVPHDEQAWPLRSGSGHTSSNGRTSRTPPRRPSQGPGYDQPPYQSPYHRTPSPGRPLRHQNGYGPQPYRGGYGGPPNNYPPMPPNMRHPSRGRGQQPYYPNRAPSSGPPDRLPGYFPPGPPRHTYNGPGMAMPRRPVRRSGYPIPPAGTMPMPTPIPVPMPTLQDPNYPHQYERLARSRSTSRPRPDTIPRDDFGNPLAALSTSPPDAPGMPGQFSPPAAGFATYRTPSPPPPLPASRSSQYFEDVDGRVAEPEAAPLPLPMALRPAPGQPPYPVSDFGG